MKAVLLFLLLAFFVCVGELNSQKTDRPRLAGTWSGGEDSSEFIYHKVEEFAHSFLKDNPNAKLVARICSTNAMPVALARSSAVVHRLPDQANHFRIPAERVFFARSSKCNRGNEEYWYVPGPVNIEYDDIVLSQKVRMDRWLVDYDAKAFSPSAQNEFMKNVGEFVAAMKKNSKTEGFLVRNTRTRNQQVQAVLKQLQRDGFVKQRLRMLRGRGDYYYPGLIAITVN